MKDYTYKYNPKTGRSRLSPTRPSAKRRPAEQAFKPELWSQGPHAHAVHDAGGKLISVPINSVAFTARMQRYAPGCSTPLDVVDNLPAEGINCGQRDNSGKLMLCKHCAPSQAESIVDKMLQ